MNEDLELYQFDSSKSPDADAWVRATYLGFHQPDYGDVVMARTKAFLDTDGYVATGVRSREPGVNASALDTPVATFGRFIAHANLGAKQVEAGMLTEATVRPTHKRRGILREMMRMNVAQLAKQQVPLALLTASDARIYERFGFSRVIDAYRISVNPAELRMRESVGPALAGYKIEWIDREHVVDVANRIYEAAHEKTRGSITRRSGYLADYLFSDDREELERKYRCFVAVAPNGQNEGFTIYEVRHDDGRFILDIKDMAYASGRAELAMWQHLFNVEMVDEIKYSDMTANSPGGGPALFRAVTNTRAVRVLGWHDALWAKVLDPIACLEARSYSYAARESELSVTFQVNDPDDYASGSYRLTLGKSGAVVKEVSEHPKVTMTANALAVLVYAAAPPSELALIGHIAGLTDEAEEVWDSIFAAVGPARMSTHF